MMMEHEEAASALQRLRDLTNDYEVPPYACNTWRALWHGLAALEESLHQHIHLENNILFPRALES
jgi:regulator of cell morphogenesis and NO signaling